MKREEDLEQQRERPSGSSNLLSPKVMNTQKIDSNIEVNNQIPQLTFSPEGAATEESTRKFKL